ncbi:MAG: S8 family peptidase [bacterium]
MKRMKATALLLSIFLLWGSSGLIVVQAVEPKRLPHNAEYELREQRLIVKFKSVFTAKALNDYHPHPEHNETHHENQARAAAQLQQLSSSAGVDLIYQRKMFAPNSHVLTLPALMDQPTAAHFAEQLSQRFDVDYAEVDKRYYATRTVNDPAFLGLQTYLQAPDTSFLSALDVTSAWDSQVGSPAITVAILDSGVINHHDLQSRLVNGSAELSGYDFISASLEARDGDGRDSNPTDEGDWRRGGKDSSWHGTNVASIIGAVSNNNRGMAGIDQQSRLLIARVLGWDGGLLSDISDAMHWVSGHNVNGIPNNPRPAQVINLSLGNNGACSNVEQEAINTATQSGAVVVVAAGNESDDTSNKAPANCSNVITVTSLDSRGDKASYANFGAAVDIATIGNHIYVATDNGTRSANLSHTYQQVSGTSMSAPIVSGVVSLMMASNPAFTNGVDLAPDQVYGVIQALLKSTANAFPAGSNCNTSICGSGMLNANHAIQAAQQYPNVFLPPIEPEPEMTIENSTEGGAGFWHPLLFLMLFVLFFMRQKR